MKVLKGVLSESWEYYRNIRSRIEGRLEELPRGSIKKRVLSGKVYYYLQYRKGPKVIHEYLGRQKPEKLEKELKERKALVMQLREVKESLKLLSRVRPKHA